MEKTYLLIHATSSSVLEDLVSAKIAEGFEPHGDFQKFDNPEGPGVILIQAVKKLPKRNWSGTSKKELDVIGKCPICGSDVGYEVNKSGKGVSKCSNKDCNHIFMDHYGRNLTRDEASRLFAGEIVELDNLVNQDGSTRTGKIQITNGETVTPRGTKYFKVAPVK